MRKRRGMTAVFLTAAALLLWPAVGGASPRVEVIPAAPRRGDAFLMRLADATGPGPVTAEFGGRSFPLWAAGEDRWEGFGAVERDAAPGETVVSFFDLAEGGKRPLAEAKLIVEDREFPVQRLTVEESKVTLSPEDQQRAAREAKLIGRALAERTRIKLWSSPLARPVEGPVTSAFGFQRIYNGKPRSPHAGLDLAAPRGTPVGAPTEGRVLLAGDFFYTGWSVFLDHGYGLVSGYFHMDRLAVGEGDGVSAGQKVGEVGSTGRSTGPHLHWSVYVSGVKVDPQSVVALTSGGEEAKPLDVPRASP